MEATEEERKTKQPSVASLPSFLDGVRREYRAMNWASKIFASFPKKMVSIGSDQSLISCCDLAIQEQIYRHVLCDEVTVKYSPALEYKKRFLKHLIAAVEESKNEIYEPLLELYMDILDAKQEDDFCYKSFELGNLGVASFKVSQAFNVLGMATWDAGFFLAEYIMAYPEKVQHKRCLELGAGLGLTGLTLCKLGTKQAVLTDYAEPVLRNLQNNLEINGMVVSPFASIPNGELEGEGQGAHVNVTALDWLIFSEDELKRFAPDVILAADVVYDYELVDALVRTLQLLLFHPTKRPTAYLCNVCRNPKTFAYFFDKLAASNIEVQDITESVHPLPSVFSYEKANLHLFILQAKTTAA